LFRKELSMARTSVPSGPVLTRRTTLARLGAGGLALGLAARAPAILAQEGTPAAVPSFLQDWADGWEGANADQIAAAYAEDAVVEVVPFTITLPGQQAILDYFTAYFGAFAEPNPRITLVFATTDQAAAEWTFEGRYTGQLQGLPPGAGQPVSIRGANIMTLRDDLIVEEHIYTDLAAILGQLGLLPPPVGTPASATPVT
jgi:steroid delta-isomerase-like uncharacterized protein